LQIKPQRRNYIQSGYQNTVTHSFISIFIVDTLTIIVDAKLQKEK
jgi:hypothetical protein